MRKVQTVEEEQVGNYKQSDLATRDSQRAAQDFCADVWGTVEKKVDLDIFGSC